MTYFCSAGHNIRGCIFRSLIQSLGSLGCHRGNATHLHHTFTQAGEICLCDSNFCNGAVLTSSLGHVIIAVAILTNVVIGHLL